MKTKSEAKVLETDVVIFPMKFAQTATDEPILTKDSENDFANKSNSIETDNQSRFARLKKSLRKRSASIL